MPPIPHQLLLNSLAGIMLVLAFFIVARNRLRTMVSMFAYQSFFLTLFAAVAASALNVEHLLITAFINFVLKVWYIPRLLVRTAVRSGSNERLTSYLRPATALVVGFLMVVAAFALTRSLLPVVDANYPLAAVAISMVFLGLLMLVSRNGLYSQIIGFLMMENGIFIFGLTLTGGMPLLVEMGIFFDVTIGSVLMAALTYRVQETHESVGTDTLRELVD